MSSPGRNRSSYGGNATPRKSEATPKRTTRNRNKPKKFDDYIRPTKQTVVKESDSSDDDVDSNDYVDEEMCTPKPKALFSNDDVEGQDLFKFKTRHLKSDLQNKAKTAVSYSPKTSGSQLKIVLKRIDEATPKKVKDIMKKRIIREVESDSSESDFSGSNSDFVPDEKDEEDVSSSASTSEEEEPKRPIVKIPNKQKTIKTKGKDSDYIVTPDNYFMLHSTKKITTSDHTLARLKNLNLNRSIEEENTHMSSEHKRKVSELCQSYEQLFDKWLYTLSEGFNIILYGIGSKRSVLHQFQMQKLQNFPCIVVNGFFPSLTIKNVLETIVIDLLENNRVPSNIGDTVSLIESQLSDNDLDLFLIIHNIDGEMLRNTKSQAMLASISQIKNVHTIATIDHINAPLLWDHTKLSKFNFTWWDVTTFMLYSEETSFENSLMSHRSGALQLSSLKSVYQSLTTNAKGIFNIIIQHQLESHKQSHYQGLPFKELYSKTREQFLVSSDIALRAQLTEFLDHKLVKMKRTYDGSENLVIPIENSLLQQFLEQQNS